MKCKVRRFLFLSAAEIKLRLNSERGYQKRIELLSSVIGSLRNSAKFNESLICVKVIPL